MEIHWPLQLLLVKVFCNFRSCIASQLIQVQLIQLLPSMYQVEIYHFQQIFPITRASISPQGAQDDFFAQLFMLTKLVPTTTVFSAFQSKLKGRKIDLTNEGHFAVLLARYCYLGDDVLDQHKLRSLLTEIHGKAFPSMSQEELTGKVQHRIEQALRDYQVAQ